MSMSSPRKASVEVVFFFKFLGLDIEVDIIGQSLVFSTVLTLAPDLTLTLGT